MPVELVLAAIILACLVAYTLFAGADFGGGVWDLFASGPRGKDQRVLIADTMAPIWEANHVWLIVMIVLLWVCFPLVYSTVSTALHIPLLVMLFGIVLRGSAFVFRSYGGGSEQERRNWGLLFSITSIITPLMLGVVLGATGAGVFEVDVETGVVQTDFVSSWLAPFPFVTGLFALTVFAYLAAVYLTVVAGDEELQDSFRFRALVSGALLGVLALVTVVLAAEGAPPLYAGLFGAPWSIPMHLTTAVCGIVALYLLWSRRFRLARLLAIAHVVLIVLDWATSCYPWMLPGQLSIHDAAAPSKVLWTTLIVMGIGGTILAPSLLFLYWVFNTRGREET